MLEGLYIEDKQGDTLLHAGSVKTDFNIFKPFGNQFALADSKVNDLTFNVTTRKGDSISNLAQVFGVKNKGNDEKGEKAALDVSLKNLSLENVNFSSIDENKNKRSLIHLPSGQINFKKFDLNELDFKTGKVELNEIDIALYATPSNKDPDNPTPFFLPNEVTLAVANLSITNGRMLNQTKKKSLDRIDDFSFSDFDGKPLNLKAKNLKLENQVLTAKINELALVDKTGFTINELRTELILGPEQLRLGKAKIRTPKSHFDGDLEFGYLSLDDFQNFNDYIDLTANIKSSNLHQDDLDYFFKEPPVDESIALSGNFSGQVSSLTGRNVDLRFQKGGALVGDIDVMGLPDVKNSFFSGKIDRLSLKGTDVQRLGGMQSVPAEIQRLGMINYSGEFTGFPSDFVAYGDINTELGGIKTDVNFSSLKGRIATYSGSLSTSNFDLGAMLEQETIGPISTSLQFDGKGLNATDLQSNFKGAINSIAYQGKTYRDIDLQGQLANQIIDGELSINDAKVIGDFDGSIDLSQSKPVFDAKTKLQFADFYALGVVDQPLTLKSDLVADINGSTMEDMLGDIEAQNLELTRDGKNYRFANVGMELEEIEGKKVLHLHSENVEAAFIGNYDFTQLIPTLKYTINKYYDFQKGWENAEGVSKTSEPIGFEVEVKDNDELTAFLFPDIDFSQGLSASGELIPSTGHINMVASSEEIEISTYSFDQWQMSAIGDGNVLYVSSAQQNIKNANTLWLDNSNIDLELSRDNILANVRSFNEDFLDANITGTIERNGDRFTISILDSKLIIDGDEWTISENNSVTVGKQYWEAENFFIENGEQQIAIRNPQQDLNTKLIADLSNLQMEDINRFISFTGKEIDGNLDGSVSIVERNGATNLDLSLTIIQPVYNGDSADIAVIDGTFIPNQKLGAFEGIISGADYDIGLNASVDLNRKEDILNLELSLERASVSPFGQLWKSSVTDVGGFVTGYLNIYGGPINYNMLGDLRFESDVTARIKYTQALYTIPAGQQLSIIENAFVLNNISVLDSQGNEANVNGSINHDSLKDFNLNIYATTNRFMFLNTGPDDSPTFYGKAFAGGVVNFTGPVTDVNLDIQAESREDTEITIQAGGAQNTSEYNFITFKQEVDSTAIEDDTKKNKIDNKLNMNFDLAIGPEARVNMLFDDYNTLWGTGEGDLNVAYNTDGLFEMTGVYQIYEGAYNSNLSNVIDVEFELERGGLIQWSGDPYTARLNIVGDYSLEADINDLRPGSASLIGSQKTNTTVEITISETLDAPELNYQIFADTGAGSEAVDLLRQINADKSLVETQAATLLLFKRFQPIGDDPFTQNYQEIAVNTVTGLVARQFSSLFTEVGIFDDIDFSYDDYKDDGNVNPSSLDKQLGVNLRQDILDGKVSIEFGSDFNFGNNVGADLQAVTIGDLIITVKLSDDGNFRLKVFSKKDYITNINSANQRRSGFGFYILKEFDSFSELFKKQQKSDKRELEERRKENEIELQEDEKVKERGVDDF